MQVLQHILPNIVIEDEVLWNYLDTEMVSFELADPLLEGYYINAGDLIYYLNSFVDYIYRRYDNTRDINYYCDLVDGLVSYVQNEPGVVVFIAGVF